MNLIIIISALATLLGSYLVINSYHYEALRPFFLRIIWHLCLLDFLKGLLTILSVVLSMGIALNSKQTKHLFCSFFGTFD